MGSRHIRYARYGIEIRDMSQIWDRETWQSNWGSVRWSTAQALRDGSRMICRWLEKSTWRASRHRPSCLRHSAAWPTARPSNKQAHQMGEQSLYTRSYTLRSVPSSPGRSFCNSAVWNYGGQGWDCTIGLAKYFDEQSFFFFFFLETETFNRLPILCILGSIILSDEILFITFQ